MMTLFRTVGTVAALTLTGDGFRRTAHRYA